MDLGRGFKLPPLMQGHSHVIVVKDGERIAGKRALVAYMYVYSNLFSNFWLILANFERPVLGCTKADFFE